MGVGFEVPPTVEETVCPWPPLNEDGGLSAPLAPCLPARCHASRHDDSGLNPRTCKAAPVKCCPSKSCLGHGVSSQQWKPQLRQRTDSTWAGPVQSPCCWEGACSLQMPTLQWLCGGFSRVVGDSEDRQQGMRCPLYPFNFFTSHSPKSPFWLGGGGARL